MSLSLQKVVPVHKDDRGQVIEWCKGEQGKGVYIFRFKKGQTWTSEREQTDLRFLVIQGEIRIQLGAHQYVVPQETDIRIFPESPCLFKSENALVLQYLKNSRQQEPPVLNREAKIQSLEIIAQEPLTQIWCSGISGKQVTLYTRKKGKVSGAHYHTGKDPSKNPERFLPLEGKMKLKTFNGRQWNFFPLENRKELLIPPLLFHESLIEEDSTFIEYRATPFNPEAPDTFTHETYESHLKEAGIPSDQNAMKEFSSHYARIMQNRQG